MRLYAPILLALLAVGAHSASLPDVQSEKKLVIDDGKPPAENVSSEPELVEPANTIIDVENNLKNNAKVEDIPVAVIVDVQPVVNNAPTEDEPEEIEVKRLLVDLKDPGPPQHQEHETQNPEYYEDAQRMVSSVKEEIQESKVVLKEGFQDVTNGIQNWYANNEQINNIQNSINNLQESFSSQLQKLNDTLQLLLKPDSKPLSLEEEKAAEKKIQNIEAGLNNLESNFKAGVQSLSEGVQVVATLKEEGTNEAGNAGSSSTAAPAQPTNILQLLGQLVTNMQSSMTTSLNNMSTAVNNFVVDYRPNFTLPSLPNLFPQNAATPLADTPVGSATTARPSAWQNIQTSFNNLFNPNQTPQNVQNDSPTQAPTGPFGIPPFPIITSIVNLIQRPGAQSTQKPAEAPQANPAPQGSNVVPGPVKPEEIAVKPEPSSNPTKKLLENSPLLINKRTLRQRL
ncbi:uncharacterized protein LOC115452672 [Manduca sexta]|uniref:uncharacterized protein LOC115452672 n=1 Tax=Manduca sexta TaxID=7130 RepID=UPI00188ED6B3|nr:uncharacterized protein LOC115452672 [Manduca sexta]